MQTITQTINVYEFNELIHAARERAKQEYHADGFFDTSEPMASLQAFAAHFGASIGEYTISFDGSEPSHITFKLPATMQEMSPSEIADRLAELGDYNPDTLKGLGDCKLTGVCYDEDAIDGFRIAYAGGERDLETLLQVGFKTWLQAVQAEYEYQWTDEFMADMSDANDWRYLVDGSFYRS